MSPEEEKRNGEKKHRPAEIRQRAENGYKESQRVLSTLLSNLPGMVYRCRNDKDWTMEFVSEGCFDLTGYQLSEFTDKKKSFAQIIHPDDQDRLFSEVQEAVLAKRAFRFEYRIRTADGKEKWVWEQGRPVNLTGGRLVLEGFITDVTERTRLQEATRHSQERLRILTDSLPALISYIDSKQRFRFANARYEEWFGIKTSDLRGRRLRDVLGKAAYEAVKPHVRAVLNGQARTFEDLLRFKGEPEARFVRVDYVPDLADKTVRGFFTLVTDITLQKKQEEETKNNERRFRLMVERLPAGAVYVEGDSVRFNRAAEEITGYSRAELSTLDAWFRTLYGEREKFVRRHYERDRKGGFPFPRIAPLTRKDGEKRVVQFAGYRVDADKDVWLLHDVTEQAQAEEAQRKARDQLEEKVAERTAELRRVNDSLQEEVAERARSEGEVRLLLAVTQAIAKADELYSAFTATLKMICEATGWDYGEAWTPNAEKTQLHLLGAWCPKGSPAKTFWELSKGLTFTPGDGIAGRIWQAKGPEWNVDVSLLSEERFSRSRIAREAGFKTAFGSPITAGGEVLAVLLFFMRQPREEDRRFIRLVSSVGNQLGVLIQRKQFRVELVKAHGDLERRVYERTRELQAAYQKLDAEARERKIIADSFREERDFAEGIIETARAIILILDIEGRVVRFNPYMQEISGYRQEEAQGKDWFATFLPERDRPRIRELFRKVMAKVETYGLNPIVTKEGKERLIEWSSKTLKDAGGATIGLLSIGQDVTERKQAEEELQRSENWLRSLIETTQDAVISIDPQGRIESFSSAAERIFGYTQAEVRGKKVNLLMPERYSVEHDEYLRRYHETGEAHVMGRIRTLEAKRKNGEVFPIEISLTRVTVGDEVSYAAFIRDITEKSKLHEQLIESERLAAVGATTASLAHEIRNPLNGMYLTAQLLERRLARQKDKLDDRIEPAMRNLTGEIIRLNHLLEEFTSFARREKYDFRAISLADLCAEIFPLERHYPGNPLVRVERDIPRDMPLVRVDRDRLKQALLNLCRNAAEAMPHGGTLTFRARSSGEALLIEISDTGRGIPEGVNVYEPFNTTKPAGAGLGLMVVRKIVAAHGGAITHESEPGKGTTFRVVLPLCPPAEASS